ncbi:MAG TPA: cysteine peptidase family C39 domain-containing protein [Gemmataceae bacterium]|nr:cysteine peptidase family C39 domain-containing protein [Gemmataceae bacterium]
MHRGYFLAILALTLWMGVLAAGDLDSVQSAYAERGCSKAIRWPSQAVMCGPNVLYMFLNAHDRPVAADVFFREVVPGDQGLSLAELRDASTRYGLPAEIRRCTYEQLIGGCLLPLIALLRPDPETAGRGTGHYVLVVDADSEGVTVVDGTSGEPKRFSRDVVCRNWEGYVIVPAGTQVDWQPLLAISVLAWLLIGWFTLRLNRSGTHMSRSEVVSKRRAEG